MICMFDPILVLYPCLASLPGTVRVLPVQISFLCEFHCEGALALPVQVSEHTDVCQNNPNTPFRIRNFS